MTNRAWEGLAALLADTATYHNPASLRPVKGPSSITAILRPVFEVMEDFHCLDRFDGPARVTLRFSARVGGSALVGADFLTFDAAGKITELMVMIRPAEVVQVLSGEAVKRLASRR